MKKIMLIGKTGSGKTTLAQIINNQSVEYKKTQSIEYKNNIIDTPGEYIEIKSYYRALIISATECDYVGFVQSATDSETYFPPNFATVLNKRAIGIVTKIDLCEDYSYAVEMLKIAGVEKIIFVSKEKLETMKELNKLLEGIWE